MTPSYRLKVARYFRQHRGRWIDGREIARVGGIYGWRTRISEARRELGMDIQNAQRRHRTASGQSITISEYRYSPARRSA